MGKHKICICFYGFLRSFEQTKTSLKNNVIEPYQPDIFISTFNTFYGKSANDPFHSQENPQNINDEYLNNNFHPYLKGYQIHENNVDFYKHQVASQNLPERNWQGFFTWRSFSMFHSIANVLNMKTKYEQDNNIKYDITILARPDLEIAKTMNLDNLDMSKLHHSLSHAAPVFGTDKLFGDHFLVSNSKNIDTFKNLYDQIANYYLQGIALNNETLMGFHLLKNNIIWEKSDFVLHGVIR